MNNINKTIHWTIHVQWGPKQLTVPLRLKPSSSNNYILWPPLLSSEQASRLQIQRSGFHSRRYQILWELVGLEQGALNLVSTTEELLGKDSSVFGLENREYCVGIRCTNHATPSIRRASPTSDGRSVGVVRSRTKAREFSSLHLLFIKFESKEFNGLESFSEY
jgi:hypothetical protein